jgi:hypothetical protein
VCSQVPLPHGPQPLLAHNGQRLAHCVEGADDARVVVAALRLEPAPVVCRRSSSSSRSEVVGSAGFGS